MDLVGLMFSNDETGLSTVGFSRFGHIHMVVRAMLTLASTAETTFEMELLRHHK
jgi:hypothetical protein